ncbi:hypothetical protein HT594_00118 [Phenacoccus solenopsis nudivirus]|nr:hypothetical protein HT594_00118 [Phenacoccus solenopsis nudivirus]
MTTTTTRVFLVGPSAVGKTYIRDKLRQRTSRRQVYVDRNDYETLYNLTCNHGTASKLLETRDLNIAVAATKETNDDGKNNKKNDASSLSVFEHSPFCTLLYRRLSVFKAELLKEASTSSNLTTLEKHAFDALRFRMRKILFDDADTSLLINFDQTRIVDVEVFLRDTANNVYIVLDFSHAHTERYFKRAQISYNNIDDVETGKLYLLLQNLFYAKFAIKFKLPVMLLLDSAIVTQIANNYYENVDNNASIDEYGEEVYFNTLAHCLSGNCETSIDDESFEKFNEFRCVKLIDRESEVICNLIRQCKIDESDNGRCLEEKEEDEENNLNQILFECIHFNDFVKFIRRLKISKLFTVDNINDYGHFIEYSVNHILNL